MNNQFATQFLREEIDPDWFETFMKEQGADELLIAYTLTLIKKKLITPEKAIQIFKDTLGVNEMSTVGGGVTGGPTAATFTPGTGEQAATTKAFKGTTKKKYQEDAPRLAGSPTKTNKQGAKNLSAYSSVGFTKAPSAQEAGKHIKGVEVKDLWEEELVNESRAYSQFKKQTATRPKDQQMHEAIKVIHKKLEEVSKLVEFAQQMRTELSEGENALEYKHNTKKIFEKINSKVVEVYTKTRQLK
jgi:hypothetical protein